MLNAVVASDGSAAAQLPAAAGSLANPPSLSCYLNEPGQPVFFLIGTDLEGPLCGLVQQGGATFAVMAGAPPGWNARFVAVY
ncbi:MAG: hypothetical protein KY467_05250 [Gemmatimonadetes bacterium]|nr:hypothetical protein [Gemmatimonadota bacterium]